LTPVSANEMGLTALTSASRSCATTTSTTWPPDVDDRGQVLGHDPSGSPADDAALRGPRRGDRPGWGGWDIGRDGCHVGSSLDACGRVVVEEVESMSLSDAADAAGFVEQERVKGSGPWTRRPSRRGRQCGGTAAPIACTT